MAPPRTTGERVGDVRSLLRFERSSTVVGGAVAVSYRTHWRGGGTNPR